MIPALEAVNELLRPQELRLDDTRRTIKGPCLLTQLHTAIEAGSGTRGGSNATGSRPPIAINAYDLWTEIEHHAHYLAWAVGIPRRDPGGTSPIPWTGRLLRTATATAHGRGWHAAVNRVEAKAIAWRQQIEAVLTGTQQQRPLRGARCTWCLATTITEDREDGTYRTPALILITRDHLAERWLVCQACGHNEPMADHALDRLHPDTPDGDQLDETPAHAA